MKRILFAFFGIFLFATGVTFTACGQPAKASISLSSDAFKSVGENEYSLELSLNEGDEHSVVVVGKVLNATDGRIKVPNDYENIVKVTTNYNAVRDENITVITALSEGEAILYFKDWGDHADPIKINVSAYSDILALGQVSVSQGTKNTQYVEKDVEIELDTNRFLTMTSRRGGESNRKDVDWTFSTEGERFDLRQTENEIILLENVSDEMVEVAKIKNNKTLIVDQAYTTGDIKLIASSKYTNLKTQVNLVVLETLATDDINLSFGRTQNSFVDFDEIAVVDAQSEGKVIPVIRNGDDETVVEARFYVKLSVNSVYDLSIEPKVYLDDKLKNVTSNYLKVTRVSYPTEREPYYIYLVKGIYSTALEPQTVYLVFNASLNDYDKTQSSIVVPVAISDIVDSMKVFDENDQLYSGDSFEIYDNYQNGKGKYFNIQLGPDTVKQGLDTYKIIVTPSVNVSADQMLSVYYNGNKIVFSKIEGTSSYVAYFDAARKIGFANNSEIYIKAENELCKTGRRVNVRFESTQTQSVYSEFDFTGEKAPNADFIIQNSGDAVKYIATNEITTVNFALSIESLENANGLYLDYNKNVPLSISSLSFEDGLLKFNVTNTELNFKGDIKFSLKHKNNRKCLTPIVLKAVVPLESANIRLDSTNSFGVSNYAYENGSLSDIILTIGASAKISFTVIGDYNLEFDSVTGALVGTDGHITSTDGAWVLSAGTIPFENKTISVTFNGCDQNGVAFQIIKDINLEVYVPASTVNPDKNIVSLISKDSLSSEDENLAREHITVKLRNDGNEVTYKELKFFKVTSSTSKQEFALDSANIHFTADDLDYGVENVILNGNLLSFDIVANSTNGYDVFRDTLNIEYQAYKETIDGIKAFDFGGRLSSTITINAQNATRVQKVTWENEVEEVRFNITSTTPKETNFILVNTIEPKDAYNASLTYIFSADDGTDADIISVSNNGIVSMKSNLVKGGTGYIFVIPSDSIKTINGIKKIVYLKKGEGDSYFSESKNLSDIRNDFDSIIENAYLLTRKNGEKVYTPYSQTFKKIKIVVEDGMSKATAFSIYTKDQLKKINPARHYVIMSNITLDNWSSFDVIGGSIYGYVPENKQNLNALGSQSDVVLTFTGSSSSFVYVLNGEIGDLTFAGNVNDAFVANVNNGTIERVTIDIYQTAGKFNSSKVSGENVGAIAVINNNSAVIRNIKVLGATVEGSLAGAIVAENEKNATIDNVEFDYYKFEEGVNGVNSFICVEEELDSENKVTINEVEYEYDEANLKLKFGESEYDLNEGVFTLNGIVYEVSDGKLKISVEDEEKLFVGTNEGEITNFVIKAYKLPVGVLPRQIQSVEAKSLSVGEGLGILMFHEISVSTITLSDYQKNQLKKLNTISFEELFNNKDIVVTSDNTEILEVNSNSIVVKQTGIVTLKIYQVPNFALSEEIAIKIIYTVSGFSGNVETISIQEKHTESITYSIKNSIYLGSEQYDLVLENYSVAVEINESTRPEGLTNVPAKQINGKVLTVSAGENTEGIYKIVAALVLGEDVYSLKIKDLVTNEIDLHVFKGARKINISTEEVSIYPANITKVDVVLDTDSVSDYIKLSIDGINTVETESFKNNYNFDNKIKVEIVKLDVPTLPINYKLIIEVNEDYKNKIYQDEIYELELRTCSGTAINEGTKIKLTLKSQVINHVDMTNYVLDRTHTDTEIGKIVYQRKNQISSILTPGKNSIMALGIDPNYAYYNYFTVSAVSDEGRYLSLAKLKLINAQSDLLNYILDEGTDATSEKYSHTLRVQPETREDQYFFKVYVPVSIKEDFVITFKVTFFDNNDQPLGDPYVYELNISYQKPAEIIVNDNDSSIIARGGSVNIKVEVAKNQTLDVISIENQGGRGLTIDHLSGPFNDEDGDRFYTATLNATYNAGIGSSNALGTFKLIAQVSRVVNGVTEIQTTRYDMTLVDIALVSTETNIIGHSGIKEPFEINYKYNPESYPEVDPDVYDGLKEIRSEFEANGYYLKPDVDFAINVKYDEEVGQFKGVPITERLYIIINGRQEKIVFNENGIADCGMFELVYNQGLLNIVGKYTTTQKIRLRLDNYIFTKKSLSSYNVVSNYYNVLIENYTDEDLPDVISSAEDFVNIAKNTEPLDFILLQDIELDNYTPFDTSMIKSFDGNGHTIKINSFNLTGSGALELALFKAVSNITTLKNLRVNYYLGGDIKVDVSSKGYSNIKIAGFAVTNNGIITNCQVMSDKYTNANYAKTSNMHGFNVKFMRNDSPATTGFESSIAGFVITNTGTITNSTVGGKSYIKLEEVDFLSGSESTLINAHEVSLDKFSIIGQGTISGFVNDNSGVITSSCVDQIEIKNESLSASLYTSGFANKNTGRISTSYIQGMYEFGNDGTVITHSLSGSSISAMGYVSGFIGKNNGSINDCYSNILLKGLDNEPASYFGAGFVYENTGRISTSYSGCKLEGANLSQTKFSGVDVKGTSLNTGEIELSYYNGSDVSFDQSDDPESTIASGAVIVSNPESESEFYGFTFASSIDSKDGIWCIEDKLITLVNPNQKTFSHRAYQKLNGNDYRLPYSRVRVDGNGQDEEYYYGGRYNPIIIRTPEEFNLAMGAADSSTNLGKYCKGGVINGSYRLLADIDLSKLNSTDGIAQIESTNCIFNGVLEGNGFKIKNISLGSGSENTYSMGLFSQIYNGTIANLGLNILSVTATKSGLVGGLAGIVYGSTLINIDVEQVLPSDTELSKEFGVQGKNAVGTIAGAIFGDCKIANIDVLNPIVQSTYYDDDHDDAYYTTSLNENKYVEPRYIRAKIEASRSVNSKRISNEGLRDLVANDSQYYMSSTSFAGGIFGYVDLYKSSQSSESSYNGSRGISEKDYKLYRLRVNDTANILGEVVGGLFGYSGINTNIKDAGIALTKKNITSNILSYNAIAGGVSGINAGNMKQIFAKHDEELQREIEENIGRYLSGNVGAQRGLLDVFENTLSFNQEVSISYKPKYIGGIIGLARGGKLTMSYSKLNVINSVNDCVAGGVIGVVTNPEGTGAYTIENNDGQQVVTTMYLNEVFASGDVLGGKTEDNKHVSGGIVGEIKGNAKLSLSAVNSVNTFGVLNENVYSSADMGEAGVYAIVAKISDRATVSTIMPAVGTFNKEKHVGYINKVNGMYEINAYPGFDLLTLSETEYFNIKSLSSFGSVESASLDLDAAFIGSANWSNENWNRKVDRLFPEIKLVDIADYIYWDQDNTLEVLRAMKDSNKEIRVRGRDSNGNINHITVNYEEFYNNFGIQNYSGRIIAGWNADGSRDETLRQAANQHIKIVNAEKQLFTNLGAGAIFENVYIDFSGNTRKILDGAILVANQINDVKFNNVHIDVSGYYNSDNENLTIQTDNGNAGLIAPSAQNTSFKYIYINFGARKIKVKFNNSDSTSTEFNFGLLAGKLLQNDNYRPLNISNVFVEYEGESDNGILIETDSSKENILGINVGLIVGQIYGENDAATISLGSVTVSDTRQDNPYTNPLLLSIGSINPGATYCVGGYYGKATVASFTSEIEKETYIKVAIPQNSKAYVGGLLGYIKSNNISISSTSAIKAEVNIQDVTGEDAEDAYIGGLIGQTETSNLTIKADSEIKTGVSYNDIKKNAYIAGLVGYAMAGKVSLTAGNFDTEVKNEDSTNVTKDAYIGGLVGKTEGVGTGGVSDFEVNVTGTADSTATPATYNIKTTIKASVEGSANIGGLVGEETAAEAKFDFTSLNANINLSGSIETINAGLIFGAKSTGRANIKHSNSSEINVLGSIVVSGSVTTTANVGGLVGNNSGFLTVEKVNVDVKIGKNADPIVDENANKGIIKASYESDVFNSLSCGSANIGGYVGCSNEGAIAVQGGEIKDSTEVAVSATGTCYVGGIVGYTTGAFTLSNETFKNSALFAVTNSSSGGETNIGGLIGEINTSNAINVGNPGSTNNAFVDANFFVSAKTTKLGGMIGKVTNANGFSLQNAIFGGAFKSYNIGNDYNHTFGGIVGWVESVTGTPTRLADNSSFGDDIITYGSDTRFSSYTFGGIIGHNNGLSLSGNYSLTTCNNDRIASGNDSRGAIVGTSNSEAYNNNLYSHVVNLCADDKGTDVGYMTAYEKEENDTPRGYNGSKEATVLATEIAGRIKAEETTYGEEGSKLNPKSLSSTQSGTASFNTNGVTYFYFGTDGTVSNQITAAAATNCKRAIIGNARVLKFGTNGTPKATSFISETLTQNEIISGMNLEINEEYDVTASGDFGGLINTMKGGTIYAVALSGKLSVGGTTEKSVNNLGAITSVNNGYIDETNSSVDVIYRGVAEKQASGFVCIWANNANPMYSIDIRNSYSTGQVLTYINASVYSFTDGHTPANQEKIRISNCYTVSQIDQNDYTTTTAPSGTKAIFGTATLTNCWYDVNGTQVNQAEVSGKLIKKTTGQVSVSYSGTAAGTGFGNDDSWVQSSAYNFGYATRKFGYLKQSSYAIAGTTYQENGTTTAGNNYTGITTTTYTRGSWNTASGFFLVPNAGKLAQVSSSLGSSYVQMYDFDLSSDKANLPSLSISDSFSGVYDGQEHTIKGLTNPLFGTISGTVKNLRLTDVSINIVENDTGSYGSVAKILSGGNINNVIASGFITAKPKETSSPAYGGIVGNINSGSVLNCKNYVKIDVDTSSTGSVKIGGIAGCVWNQSSNNLNVSIENCINYAPIRIDSTAGERKIAGGIVGEITSNIGSITISACGNTDSVIAGYTSTTSASYFAGGIVGRADKGLISNCYNTAMIKAGNKSSTVASYAGGIVGKAAAGTFEDLYNSGVVEALGKNGTWTATANATNVTVKTENAVNVYAGGISYGKTGTNYRNDGQVFENGVHNTDSKEYTCEWDESTKTGGVSGFDITVDNYLAHITGYDDLGYPSSLCVTAERDVKISGTNVFVVQNQKIITKTRTLEKTESYYELSKSKFVFGGNTTSENWTSDEFLKIMNNEDKSTYGKTLGNQIIPETVTIAGNKYQIAVDKGTFDVATLGSYQTVSQEVNLKTLFSGNYEALVAAGYKFVPEITGVDNTNVTYFPEDCSLTLKNAEGVYDLMIGYICNSGETVEGINFTYKIDAVKDDFNDTITVEANTLFKEGENNYKLYIGNDRNEDNDYVYQFMSNGEEYNLKVNDNEYTATYNSSLKTLEFETSNIISNGDLVTYNYLNSTKSSTHEMIYNQTKSTQTENTYSATDNCDLTYVMKGTDYVLDSNNSKRVYINAVADSNTYAGASNIGEFQLKNLKSIRVKDSNGNQLLYADDDMFNWVETSGSGIINSSNGYDANVTYDGNDFVVHSWITKDNHTILGGSIEDYYLTFIDFPYNIPEGITVEYEFKDYVFNSNITEMEENIVNFVRAEGAYTKNGLTYRGTEQRITETETATSLVYRFVRDVKLTKISKTITKNASTIGVYVISDNYGQQISKVDSTNGTSISYELNYSNPTSDVIITTNYKEYKLSDSASNSHLDSDFVATYNGNNYDTGVKKIDLTTNIKPEEIQNGSTISFVAEQKILNLYNYTDYLNSNNENISAVSTSSVGYIEIAGVNYKVLIIGNDSVILTDSSGNAFISTEENIPIGSESETIPVIVVGGNKYILKISNDNSNKVQIDSVLFNTTEKANGDWKIKTLEDYTSYDVGQNSITSSQDFRPSQEDNNANSISTQTGRITIAGRNYNFMYDDNSLKVGSVQGVEGIIAINSVAYSYILNKNENEETGVYSWKLILTPLVKLHIETPACGYAPYTFTIIGNNLKAREASSVVVLNENIEYTVPNYSFKSTIRIDETEVNNDDNENNYSYNEANGKITFKRTEQNENYNLSVTYNSGYSNSGEINNVTFSPANIAGVIIKADINLGTPSRVYNITQKVSGNGYFVNYFAIGSEFISSLTGQDNFIRDLNIGGLMINTQNYMALGINTVGSNTTVKNLSVYGSMSQIAKNLKLSAYFTIKDKQGTIENINNFANYSAFSDEYEGADVGAKLDNTNTNYGLIVGFDGRDGETWEEMLEGLSGRKRDRRKRALMDNNEYLLRYNGRAGQSFWIKDITDSGIIIPGRGGNGTRGTESFGGDSVSSEQQPYHGYSGGVGGAGGASGKVYSGDLAWTPLTKNNNNEFNIIIGGHVFEIYTNEVSYLQHKFNNKLFYRLENSGVNKLSILGCNVLLERVDIFNNEGEISGFEWQYIIEDNKNLGGSEGCFGNTTHGGLWLSKVNSQAMEEKTVYLANSTCTYDNFGGLFNYSDYGFTKEIKFRWSTRNASNYETRWSTDSNGTSYLDFGKEGSVRCDSNQSILYDDIYMVDVYSKGIEVSWLLSTYERKRKAGAYFTYYPLVPSGTPLGAGVGSKLGRNLLVSESSQKQEVGDNTGTRYSGGTILGYSWVYSTGMSWLQIGEVGTNSGTRITVDDVTYNYFIELIKDKAKLILWPSTN